MFRDCITESVLVTSISAEKMKRSLFATYVDKDTGKDQLTEKFPEAKEITLRQHNFQWYCLFVVIYNLYEYTCYGHSNWTELCQNLNVNICVEKISLPFGASFLIFFCTKWILKKVLCLHNFKFLCAYLSVFS